jgi:hypothetical protein
MLKMNLITREELCVKLYCELCDELYWELYGEFLDELDELYEEVNRELCLEVWMPLGSQIHTDFREYNRIC